MHLIYDNFLIAMRMDQFSINMIIIANKLIYGFTKHIVSVNLYRFRCYKKYKIKLDIKVLYIKYKFIYINIF